MLMVFDLQGIYIYIPGSSKSVKFVPFHPKNLPKNINFTYMEDPGIYIPGTQMGPLVLSGNLALFWGAKKTFNK